MLVSFTLSDSRAHWLARSSMVLCMGDKNGEKEMRYMRGGLPGESRVSIGGEKNSIRRIEKKFHHLGFRERPM